MAALITFYPPETYTLIASGVLYYKSEAPHLIGDNLLKSIDGYVYLDAIGQIATKCPSIFEITN